MRRGLRVEGSQAENDRLSRVIKARRKGRSLK